MPKLFIIGNGFDLHHKMKTRYLDFKSYLKSYDKRLVEWYENMFRDNIINNESLWNDIENNSYFSYQQYMHKFELYDDPQDIDNERFAYPISQTDNDVYSSNKFYNDKFKDWVNSIKLTKSLDDIKKIISKDDYFITFNYTYTLEKLYNIPDSHIYHIHGKKGDDELLFGSFTNKPYKAYEEIDRLYSDRGNKKYIDILSTNIKNICKNASKENDLYLTKIANLNLPIIDEIVIYGHHISNNFVDMKYYDEYFIPNYKDIKWTFYYYSDNDKTNIYKFINKYKLLNTNLINIH